MDPLTIGLLVVCFALGLLIGIALIRSKYSQQTKAVALQVEQANSRIRDLGDFITARDKQIQELTADLTQERERRAILEGQNKQMELLQTDLDLRNDQIRDLHHRLDQKIAECSSAEERARRLPIMEKTMEQANLEMRSLRDTIMALEKRTTELTKEREAITEKVSFLERAEQKLADSFKALSRQTLQENNQSFLTLAEQSFNRLQDSARSEFAKRQDAISEVVKPVGESLHRFDQRVRDLELKRESAYSILSEQVRSLSDGQSQLRTETKNLVQALRSPSTRGRWGEIQLRRVVELAGMLQHCDIYEQVSQDTDEGRQRPDMIVKLPGNKNIIVDAKVPLAAYLDALEAQDEKIRKAKMMDHARQVRDHITKLSRKSYWEQFKPTPEYVILFLSGEAFLYAALENDPSLIEDGFNERVILATPTTLIAMLKAAAYGWGQETITQNAREISDLGAELYKRLSTVGDHFSKLGANLDKAVRNYNDSVGSLERNVLSTARKLKDSGISTGGNELQDPKQIETTTRLIERAELKAPTRSTLEDEVAAGPALPPNAATSESKPKVVVGSLFDGH